jgi:zona occludens toxin (predicted ATPase)
VTSQRKIEANRFNAKKSTGPKTRCGRARSAKNARRHGLSLSVFADLAYTAEIERMATEIVSRSEDRATIELARRVTEAQMDLTRIRRTRHSLLERNGGLNKISEDVFKQLIAMDRYERRAVSRRKFAMRELGCALFNA